MNNIIELRNIYSLSGKNFYIPDYQRGYRWTSIQAIQLLKDLYEFYSRFISGKLNEGEFYCLQPIVVIPKGKDIYEVIDGQQRLTTLFILLKCLGEDSLKRKGFSLFHITYGTRNDIGSDEFLNDIESKTDEEANRYIDFFYMKLVYNAISSWLIKNPNSYNVETILLSNNIEVRDNQEVDTACNVRFIWYQIDEDENEGKASTIDIFTRLNIGKIPLTNAELVKALLLQKRNFKKSSENELEIRTKQIHISEEWNQIEHRLQDNAFWFFIYNASNPIKYDTRIEYIFDLMKGKYESSATDEDKGTYFTFECFNEQFNGKTDRESVVDTIWTEIKDFFSILEYWYSNRELFHLVGFLIECGVKVSKLVKYSRNKNKSEFLVFVKRAIKFIFRKVKLDKLKYNHDNMRRVLLLFNVLTVLESDRSDLKFPFDKYKSESWDKEHIASQTTPEFPNDIKKKRAWLDDMIFYFVGLKAENEEWADVKKALDEEITNQKKKKATSKVIKLTTILMDLLSVKEKSLDDLKDEAKKEFDDEFNSLYKSVSAYFDEGQIPEEEKDNISNMALLNASINRSYGNAFFPIKRSYIKENDKSGVFVPIATKNVFMKYYSKKIDNMMYWTQEDASSYMDSMREMLKDYITK